MDNTPIEVIRGDACVACREHYSIGTPVWIETDHVGDDVVRRLGFVLCDDCSKRYCSNHKRRRLLWTSDKPLGGF
jgi:hypothetical protein